ncbi:EFR1 family ferrodoxin [Mycoplasmatota bacterium]|nr:EFR1 family ferrodoxin [Mycoplasmatota bacterium]
MEILDEKEDLLVLLYPVFSGNSPRIVNEWIQLQNKVDNTSAVIISVSGGGEISPNTASRVKCKKQLKRKGYNIFYENMLIMPSNCIVRTKEDLAIRLLKVLPEKVNNIINQIMKVNKHIMKPLLIDRFLSLIFILESIGAKRFGRKIKITDSCISCSLCEKNCPTENIKMIDGKPSFGNKCIMCLKCIYSCPKNALKSGVFKSMVFEEGFNLKRIEDKLDKKDLQPVSDLAKGYIWKGVKEYLKDYD